MTYDVLIIGGGPGGATTAAVLAKNGIRVALIEQETSLRYHIGESQLIGIVPILHEIGAFEKIDTYGFVQKRGSTYRWGSNSQLWNIQFEEIGSYTYSYQVDRAIFDSLLLENARELGVDVIQPARFLSPIENTGRVIGAKVQIRDSHHNVHANYVVDASGQSAVISSTFSQRVMDPILKNVAIWSYFEGGKTLPAPYSGNFLGLSVEDGWMWYIPLRDKVSVGYVTASHNATGHPVSKKTLQQEFFSQQRKDPIIRELLSSATNIDNRVFTSSDWSYMMNRFWGPGWMAIGDACGFIDPVLSSGTYFAMTSGYLVASSIIESLERPDIEVPIMMFYEQSFRQLLTQMLDLVKYFYDRNRSVNSYFWKARQLVADEVNLSARQAFIYMASGTHGNTIFQPFKKTVFKNLQ
ncbi:NAD(P)/FAD-dependent oxidoreductase [Sulfobacillus thermosulfidooxidans]|uniref:NAD(P)/FAD-dependent oxidoreductase n=1 Tax=Sulfobacillus thermosulfidooxidans TaxID=28034 RepID=UPI0002DF6AD3|nr:NAD(P)/FAD-dependent oxidoreductase [Sulfobacillus thermosulfidooxidans]